ncbi:MAG: hypothetical protein HZB70_03320 [Candidatus Berkelbacteria bacterium]|nr:MAG: hypothetical protein HZB70_03320 [Candidatus Berkelbacteria bacterium]QQG51668.1 MAG: hypothetical protein HY845_03870 [Candidatus Berkelbacteria bacterium]
MIQEASTRRPLAGQLLIALIVFLPLSAWLVSFFGTSGLSFGRDILLLGLIITLPLTLRFRPAAWVALLLLINLVLSYFWRGEELNQWLRAVRYLGEPLLLYLVIARAQWSPEFKAMALKTFAFTLGGVAILGFLEYIFPAAFRITLNELGRGYLGDYHKAAGLPRMQSLLAGPNALGLYLMVGILSWGAWRSIAKRYGMPLLIILAVAFVLTVARSAALGLVAGLIAATALYRSRAPRLARGALIGLAISVFAAAAAFWLVPASLIREDSTIIRSQQYERLFDHTDEIGWLGRGPGSTGPVSQDRLDGGENRFTENTYLDMYEGLGVFGGLLYPLFWVLLLVHLANRRTALADGAFVASIGLVVAGIFLNHYTGQAAIWMTLMLAGLASSDEEGSN